MCGAHSYRPIHISPTVPTFHPEFGKYMIESTPGAPYGATLRDLLAVEDNMIWR